MRNPGSEYYIDFLTLLYRLNGLGSRVILTPEQMDMYDITNWHVEVKIVSDDFKVGKGCSPWSEIPLTFAELSPVRESLETQALIPT